MSHKKLQKSCILTVVLYFVLAGAFYLIAGEQLRLRYDRTDAVMASQLTGEIVQGMELRQPFIAEADEITGVSMLLSTYARDNTSHTVVQVVDAAETVLAYVKLSNMEIEDNTIRNIGFSTPVAVTPGETYALVLTSPDGTPGNAITAWTGDTMPVSRAEVPVAIPEGEKLLVNGVGQAGKLHFALQTCTYLWFGQVYWPLVLSLGVLLAAYCLWLIHQKRRGRSTLVLRLLSAFARYGYLMRQLVSRDFKTKYKRSVLGVLWSFLNPLLTMMVQYIVFSTLFRSDIPNFRLYLLSGIVCFNFFSEASGMALSSIVGNASLITKVYVPKYIYPVTRVLSSTINLLLSLIPLLAVMLLTKTPVRPAILLLPFGLICLVAFCMGIGLILSTMMVFFRDTQFLWGVISMLWMYATPIFYPDSIIPSQYMTLYKCNPLYHIIRFVRIILIDGVSPEPKAYGLCLIASFVPLVIGAVIFKKNQDKFILNL